MQPIRAHAWGLGTIGATAYKGGWLRASTATRQMGIVDGYAVAIITTAGPAVRQTDGDSAHVRQMNRLARLLEERLAYERSQPLSVCLRRASHENRSQTTATRRRPLWLAPTYRRR